MSIKKNYSKSTAKQSYKFRFNKHQSLGSPDAETDKNLENVYIDNGAIEVLSDIDNQKCIIIGRTGSGKSALIKTLLEREEKIIQLAPEAMSLKFLSNSTILDYFRKLDIKLNFFYKVLWKHVFIVELLKLYLGETEQKKQSLFDHLWSKINRGSKSDIPRKAALEYFEKWSDEFWMKSEHRIKTLEQDLEEKFIAETGVDKSFLKMNINNATSKSEKNISEIKYKAEQIISSVQAEDLINLMEILKQDVFNNNQRKFFIVIDDLDKEWVSPQIVYDLIGAMVEVIKEFQEKFQGIKIVIALRDNLHHLIFTGKEHRGGQREKFAPLFLNLTWDTYSLKLLMDSRIQLLTDTQLTINNLFERSPKNKVTPFEYILERTYMRPRDLISYFNKIIERSDNKTHFNNTLVREAETPYSIERLQALEDEWHENYGDISKAYNFLFGIHNGFNLINLKEDSFTHLIFDQDAINSLKGELRITVQQWKESEFKPNDFKLFLSETLFILFRIGIIGIKRKPELSVEYFYNQQVQIRASDFNQTAKIYIHKSLYSALKINSKEQEIDYLCA